MKIKEARVHRGALSKKKRAATDVRVEADDVSQTEPWTGGPAFGAKVIHGALIFGLCCGPAALAVALVMPRTAEASHVASQTDVATSFAVGERAGELVTAWLGATRTDDDRLAALYDGPVPSLPDVAVETTSPTIAQVTDQGDGLWSVTVAIDVQEPLAPAPDGTAPVDGPGPWQHRYFHVPVKVTPSPTGATLQALMLPAPVAPPSSDTSTTLDYPSSLPINGPLGESVTSFLAALTTGQGEIARYITPTTTIAAITPAPYISVKVQSMFGRDTSAVTEPLSEGQDADIVVTALLERADGQTVATNYQLSLTMRSGRWEVAALAQTPATDSQEPAEPPALSTSDPAG